MPARIAMNSGKYLIHYLLIITLFDITYSHDNDTSTEARRHGRVSGRIVKLYSGPKPDPILCTSEGFLADAVDCSVFYRCLKATNGKYTVYRFQCGPGTVYDPQTEICNHPRNTKRLECSGLNSNKLITSTERYIENEIDGVHKENPELPSPIITKPPKDLNTLISSTAMTQKPVKFENSYVTTYPWLLSTENINRETSTTSTTSPWTLAAATSSKKPWEFTQTTNYVTRRPTTQNGVQCTSDGFMGDNEDCRKFYRCVNNQRGGYLRYEFSCSESTIWDDDTQGCNHPWAVQRRRCGKGNNYDENSIGFLEQIKNNEVPNNIIQQQLQASYGSKVTQIQPQTSTKPALQNQAPVNFGDLHNIRNENVKQNQTQINNSALISQSQTQYNYGNEVTPNNPYSIHSILPSQTQTPISNNISSSTIITTSTPYRKGSNRCTRAGFIGDSNDCKKFYRCLGNDKRGFTVYEFSCTEGTLWDQELEACNHAWAVKECGGKKSSPNIPPINAIVENTTFKYYTTTAAFQSNEIENSYYGNQNNHQEVKSTASTVTQSTSLSSVFDESTKSYETTDCKSDGFFGNINDCSKFYRCVESGGGRYTKYEYKCGDGTVWDPEIESCNHVWLVKSCGSSRNNGTQNENLAVPSSTHNMVITTVSLIQTTTQKNIPDHDYDSGYHILQSETSLQSTTTTERTASQGNECKTSGFMGDSDCKKFYRCVENGHGGFTRHEFTCGEGTVWDPSIEACNHAYAVKTCGHTSVQDNAISSVPAASQDYNNNNNYYDTEKDSDSTIKTTTSSSTTIHITSVTNKANGCQSNGFIGDDNDCKIFYRCVENGNEGFIRYEFSCGDGTVWDPKISACNHAWAVEKCGGNNSANLNPSTQDPNFTTASTGSETSTQHTTLSSSSTILTSTQSDSNNQCRANGFMGDKRDCKKFYRCVEDGKGSFTRYEFNCGDGTVWDSKIQACNHAWAVESCGSNESSNSESVPTSGLTTLRDEDTNNNHVTQSNQEIGSTESTSWSSSTVKSTTTIGNSDECTSEGFMGDSNDCKKFYRCVNDGKGSFIRYEFSCGDGTIWDSEINACNHANSVKTPCRSTINQVTDEKEPNYTVSSSTAEDNDYATTSTSKKPASSHQCDQEGFFGDETDCKKFYRCTDNGQGGFHKYEFTCGDGTVWDQEILACNHESSYSKCGSTSMKPETGNTDVYSTTISSVTSQSTEITQTSSSNDECNSEGFYANSNDCKKFFRCVGDGKGGYTRYDFTCGEGTIWVQDIQACDHDSDTSLCSKGTVTSTTTISPSHSSQEKPITQITTLTTSSTIDRTTIAPSTKPTIQDESVSGSSSTSETSFTASTSSSVKNEDRCEEAGYFGNTQDCKMFYRCVDDGKGGFTKYDFTCADGTIWDQDITACNHPQDVSNPSCVNGGNTGSTTTTKATSTTTTVSNETSEPTKGTSSTESTTTQSSAHSTQQSSTQKPNSGNYTCSEAGYYADPYDCKKFYRCVDWGGDGKTFSIYHFDCGEGTIWDPNLQTCNHEESVYPPRDCSGTQSQTENSNTTTTTTTTTTTEKHEETTKSSTTEGTTTTEQSTTEKSTTQSSSTTGSSSTTDQSSTQESSTSEQTSSTEQSSTQSSTTEQSTTQSSTTEQSTTQSSTTEQTTTQKSTTEESTTQKSTTVQSTTEKSTTEQSPTQQSTTTSEQSSTTQQSSTSEQTTTTTEPTTTSSNEETTTTTAQTTTAESTTSNTDQTTKAEQSTTQESTEQSSESQSSTTEQSTTQETTDGSSTTESGQETTTEQESSNKECPQIDDDQYMFVCPTGFRRHPKYCNLFYQCTEDDDTHEMKVAVFNCPNNTIYDESKTQCVEEDKADKKCDGQIAQRRRVKRLDAYYKEPITVGKDKYLCTAVGHFPFEKNERCSPVLFKCDRSKSGKLRGFIYQCPEGYVYWSISRRCEPVSTLTDCRRSLFNWNGRYEIPVERNNVARKPIK